MRERRTAASAAAMTRMFKIALPDGSVRQGQFLWLEVRRLNGEWVLQAPIRLR